MEEQVRTDGVSGPRGGVEQQPDLGRELRRPLSVGFTLLLVLGNVIGWVWFVQHQDEQFAMVQSEVSSVSLTMPSADTDPTLCWLIGAEARAAGHAKQLLSQVTVSGVGDTCADAVIRGANGYGR